jgi:hypothetical protein
VTDLFRPRLLRDIPAADLIELVETRRWPKWSSMCLLHRIGLRVLNGVCVTPQHRGDLGSAIDRLAKAISSTRLMVRSDGGAETASYYRGGNSYPVGAVAEHAGELLDAGRAVLLLEPTVRFTNRLTVLMRMDRGDVMSPGAFTIEALGPGYDAADLTRGGIQPQVTVEIDGVDWRRYREPWWSDLQVVRQLGTVAEEKRRAKRLEKLASSLSVGSAQEAEHWLQLHQYTALWQGGDPTTRVVRSVREWFDVAFFIAAAHPNRGWRCLAVAASDLGQGGLVYWDVVDGDHKFGSGRPT